MKRDSLILMSFLLILSLVSCNRNNMKSNDSLSTSSINSSDKNDEENMKINLSVNDYNLEATLLDNASAKAFYDLVKEGLTLQLSEYGGFEKVGPIGKTLPSNDSRINAQPGDLILYASNQLSLMYGSNSWSYTKLGMIDNLAQLDLKAILGDKDVTVVFSIK